MVNCLVNSLIAELFSRIPNFCLLISLNKKFTFVIRSCNFLFVGFFTCEGIWLISQSEKKFIFNRTLFLKSFKTRLKPRFHGLGTGVYLGTRVGTGMSGTEASNKLFVALFILV